MRAQVEVRERTLGPDHPETIAALNLLATQLETMDAFDEAEAGYRKVLEARERVLGPEHPSTLVSVNNLALLLSSKGDYAGSQPLYERALEASERVLAPNHPPHPYLPEQSGRAAGGDGRGGRGAATPRGARPADALQAG